MHPEEQESNGSSEGCVATGYSPREKAAEILPSAGNAHLPREQTVSLPPCAGTGHREAVEQTAQQATQLGSDTATGKIEEEPFFHQTDSRLHCHELGW